MDLEGYEWNDSRGRMEAVSLRIMIDGAAQGGAAAEGDHPCRSGLKLQTL